MQHTTTTLATLSSPTGKRVVAGVLYVVLTMVLGLGFGGAFASQGTATAADGTVRSNDPLIGAPDQVPAGAPSSSAETTQPPATPKKKPTAGLPGSAAPSSTEEPPGGTVDLPTAGNAPDTGTGPPSSAGGTPPSDGGSAPGGGMAPPAAPPGDGGDTATPPAGPANNGGGPGAPPAGPGTPGEQAGDDAPPADTGETSGSAPTAGDDTATVNEDTAVAVPVLGNDAGQFDSLSISSAPANGTTHVEGDLVVYEPNSDFNGTDTFTYEICNGTECSTATVTVNVNPVNDAPTALDIAESVIVRGSVYSGCVLQVIDDVDGDQLVIESVGTPDPVGSAEVLVAEQCQAITYTHPGGWVGVVVIPFTASDGNGGTVSAEWHVTVENQAPVAEDDSWELDLSVSLSWCLPVLSNDYDLDGDALSIVSADAYEGTATEPGTCPEGQIHYTAFSDPFLPPFDTIEYSITDGYGGAGMGTVHITLVNG